MRKFFACKSCKSFAALENLGEGGGASIKQGCSGQPKVLIASSYLVKLQEL